jgi:hypothetical protein
MELPLTTLNVQAFLKMATKFLTWLKEAEEDSSDEDSDDSE